MEGTEACVQTYFLSRLQSFPGNERQESSLFSFFHVAESSKASPPPTSLLNSPKHLISKGKIQITIIFPQLRQSCTIYNRSLENCFLPSAAASIDLSQLPTVNLGIVQEQILQSMKR